ncbi:MAG: hypothetical protein K8T89_02225 [Planctomycetes bacterium]|nr:hypothetical protein [Planctomycetota bacterium]
MNTPSYVEAFARIVVSYQGCTEAFARSLLLGKKPINVWQPSSNEWDWLVSSIYFWEHSPERALRWAKEKYRTGRQKPAVLGGHFQLGR